MDELEQYYQYLKSHGADVPTSYNSFKTTLKDRESATQYYDYLKQNKFDTPDNFDSFAKTFNLGFDSKEVKAQAEVSGALGVPNQNDQFLSFGQAVPQKAPVNKSGSPIGVAVGKDKKKDGSLLGGLYNTIVSNVVAPFFGGIPEITGSLTKAVVPMIVSGSGEDGKFNEAERAVMDFAVKTKLGDRKETVEFIEKARSGSSTKEQEQARSEFDVTDSLSANDVEAMMFQFPSQALNMVLGAFTAGSSFFIQSVNDNAKELDANPNAADLTDAERLGHLFIRASVQTALDKIALSKVLKSTGLSKKLTQKLSAEIAEEFAEKGIKATAKQIEDAAIKKATQLTSKIKIIGVKAATGFVAEGGTEGLQSAFDDSIKLLTNKIKGKEIFDENDIRNNFFKKIINSTVQGGVFGGGFGGGHAVLTNTNKAIRKEIANIETPEDLQNLQTQINEQVETGTLTPEEAAAVTQKAQQYVEIAAKIPPETDSETKYALIGGIEQREDLKNEIAKVQEELTQIDPAFHAAKNAQIELLEGKLGEVNDYIESIVTGEKAKYVSDKGEYFKVGLDGEKTPITKQHYDLAVTIEKNTDKVASKEEIKNTHGLAKDAGIEVDTDEFKAISNELTGQEHLDKMTPEQLTKINDYINETKRVRGEPENISKPIELSVEENNQWNELPLSEKLKLAKENLPEVSNLSDIEVAKIADIRAKELLSKIPENEKIKVENIETRAEETNAGITTNNELIPAEKSIVTETIPVETIQPTTEKPTEVKHPEILKLEKERDSKINTSLPFIEDAATLKKVYKAKQKVRGKEVNITVGIEQAQIKKSQKVLERILNDCL